MIRGMYGAATALDVAGQAQDVIAQNLAHATVPGYRARGVAFETFDRTLTAQNTPAAQMGTEASRSFSDFRPGATQFTGNPLDVALDGDSFFVLQGPNGPLYSRDGVFQRGANGQLQNGSGLPVLGDGGPITIPAGATQITVAGDGTVQARDAGGAVVPVGKLQQVSFADPNRLNPAGTALFSAPADAPSTAGTASVMQGYREMSNVQPASEMVAMIRNSRYFDAAQRALRALSEAVQLNTKPT